MRRITLKILYVVSLLIGTTGLGFAQAPGMTPIGTPPFSSLGGGPFDVINLANLNIHFTIPIRQKAGRGIPFIYNLQYDSSLWTPTGLTGQQTWQPSFGYWGWQGLLGAVGGNLSYSET